MKRTARRLCLAVLTLTLSGCATGPTPEQIKARQDAEEKATLARMDTALKMATNPKTGEVDRWLYMVLLHDAIYGNTAYVEPAPSISAPTSGTYGNPVMVITPTPGMMMNSTGGITTYNSGSTYCQSGYGVASCY